MYFVKHFIFIWVIILIPIFSWAQTIIQIQKKDNAPIINKHIYGHFSEHLGRCIYDGFYVGENSEIPNTNGVRNDVVKALKALQIPNLRWPGGCFADTYHWMDGIGPKSERPTIVNQWWGGVTEDNSFGTHDFLNMCEWLETEPYLAANVGSGTVKELADWVQYVNHDGISPMADLRKKNGREKPWGVRFWGIGNEMWGCGGHMTADYYANLYRQYATFMTNWDNSTGLYRIASGASDGDYNWTETLMKNIPHHLLDGVALHSYSVIDWGNKGSATEFTEEQYFITMQRALRMDEFITKHIEVMDKYDKDKKVDLIVDEWGGWYQVEEGTNPGFLYQQNTMRDAMIAGATLNIFNNHADRVFMANLAQTINVLQAVILTEGNEMILTPTYHVMHMYKVHHGATLLHTDFEAPKFEMDGEVLPSISVSASENSDGKTHISLVNIDIHKAHEVEIVMDNMDVHELRGSILVSSAIQDYNSFDNKEKIQPKDFNAFTLKENRVHIILPPASVIVLSE